MHQATFHLSSKAKPMPGRLSGTPACSHPRVLTPCIMSDLSHDPLIGPQGLVFRQYVPLETFEIGGNEMPMTNEWRCFFYKNTLVDFWFYGFITDNLDVVNAEDFSQNGLPVAQEATNLVSEFTNFLFLTWLKTTRAVGGSSKSMTAKCLVFRLFLWNVFTRT